MNYDCRIRTCNKATPVPRGCLAYVFYNVYFSTVKVIISDSQERALSYFKQFALDQGLDLSQWRITPMSDDFDLVLANDGLQTLF